MKNSRTRHPARTTPSAASGPTAGGGVQGGCGPGPSGQRPKKILIIDDDPDIVIFFTALLEENGYATCVARDGEEAMRVFLAERPDLVTLDIAMPKAWGPLFHHRLSQEGAAGTPFIVISGMPMARHAVPGAKAFLTKPVTPGELLRQVRAILG